VEEILTSNCLAKNDVIMSKYYFGTDLDGMMKITNISAMLVAFPAEIQPDTSPVKVRFITG
jgi:hypothetical protein